jgi:hypothetical protein
MPSTEKGHSAIPAAEQELVLASLEPEQLAGLKKHHIPRRHLKGAERFVMFSLRLYLLFMVAVVLYQVFTSVH